MSKKLEEKQRRRMAEQMRRDQQRKAARRSNIITIAIAVVIAAAVTFFVINERAAEDEVPVAPAGVSTAEAGCDEAEEHKIEGSNHVTGEVQYGTSPPTSGDHFETPADPGFYTTAVEEEPLVHNLEHGQIVIWYSPEASQQTLDDLERFEKSANDPDASGGGAPPIIVVPYGDVPDGKSFAMTAWGRSQACERYSLSAINDFRKRFQGRGPEQVTAPFEG